MKLYLFVTAIGYLMVFGAYMQDATAESRSGEAPRWVFGVSSLVMLSMAAWGANLLWSLP